MQRSGSVMFPEAFQRGKKKKKKTTVVNRTAVEIKVVNPKLISAIHWNPFCFRVSVCMSALYRVQGVL